MAITYTIDVERGAVTAIGTGVLTEQDVIEVARQVYRDPRFHPDLRGYVDFSGLTQWAISNKLLIKMAESRNFSAKSRTAICAKATVVYGMSRMFQAYARKGRVKVFADPSEARSWLNEGVPPDKVLS